MGLDLYSIRSYGDFMKKKIESQFRRCYGDKDTKVMR